jgi:hypothetical protein
MTRPDISAHISALIAALLSLIVPPAAHAQSAAPYEAMLSDGTRVEGSQMTGWHKHTAVPHLQGVPLHDARRQLLWLRNRDIRSHNPSENRLGFIEFVGGDRFVGRVVGLCPSDESEGLDVPAHLLVRLVAPLHVPGYQPTAQAHALAHILPGRIQRVVWGHASQHQLKPGTVFYLDGRQLGFLHLRWQRDSVRLLLKNGMREVDLSNITEVHLPRIDPWQAYYEELAVLSPSCRSRLVRLETTGGLIATGSDLRFRASPYATPAQKQQAEKHLKRLDEQINKANAAREASHKDLQQARAEYQRQLAEAETRKKAAKQASDKAVADTRQRIANLRKADAARLKKQRQQLEQEFRAAEQAMQQRLAAVPAQKREKELKAFRQKQAQTRKKREKSLEDERLKLERQRQKELEQFIKGDTQKLKKLEQDLAKQVAAPKQRVAEKTKRWEQYSKHLESVRSQRASARDPQGRPRTWRHMVQPVWSLDPLWVPFRSIHTRWSFAPEQVPLCRVRPAATVSPPLLPWYTNHNSDGGPLRSGGQQHGWGFAVHAYSELRFPLPKCANAFRSRMGLDRIVGPGGCVQARVYVGSVKTSPVYQSPLLVGSKKTADTGRIRLKLPSKGPKHLVLQVDPAHDNRPAGADPLNIRDKLDWLDPRLELDRAKLQDQVYRHVGLLIAGSQGWKLTLDRRGVYTWTSHFDETGRSGAGRFLMMLQAQGQPLRFSREMTIGPADKWLAVQVGLPTGENPRPDAVILHVGQRQIKPRKVPIRQRWQSWPAPLLFPIDEYQGKKITLELKQAAGGKPLHWRAVSTSEVPPPAYRLVDIIALAGKSDMQVPYELGQALQSDRISDPAKLAALEINQLGGAVNFRPGFTLKVPLDSLTNVLVGKNWTGGDKMFIKIFTTLKKMPSLKTLLVTEDSGVTRGAIAKLQAEMPKLTIIRFVKRLPSLGGGKSCHVTWRNLTDKDVLVLYINPAGKLQGSRYLKPGQEMKRQANVGNSYEAHYLREDHTRAMVYASRLPLATHVVTPGAVWEIKPRGR